MDLSRAAAGQLQPAGLNTVTLAKMARKWARSAEWRGLESVSERSWRVVASSRDFDAWLIAWPAGGAIELHDHGASAGAIAVVSGTLVETRAERESVSNWALTSRELVVGAIPASFTQGEIHDVSNLGETVALSLHIYSPRLETMTFYRVDGSALVADRHEIVADGAPESRAVGEYR